MQTVVDQHQLGWEVDSAGTSNWHEGEPPHHRSIKIAKNHGIDLTHQRARPFKAEDMTDFDYIYVMDSENYRNVKKAAGNLWNPDKVDLILNAVTPGKDRSVPDPWFEDTDRAFEEVYQLLAEACEQLVRQLKNK